jgi:HPt (histidine-containing phosphotransfer) domain-containing protein
LQETPRCISRISGALVRGDLPEVGRAAHRLKGSATSFGAASLVAILQGIEEAVLNVDTDVIGVAMTELNSECARVVDALRAELEQPRVLH